MDEMKRCAVVFPGQASQYVGMGREFIEGVPECLDIIQRGEKITSLPLRDRIINGPMDELTRTLVCQPAVFGISMVCWHMFTGTGFSPFCTAGHSLGEYSALVASRVITLEEGFFIVKRRAQIMDDISCRIGDGKLLAILGLNLNDVEHILKEFPKVEIANVNSDVQVVVGGRKGELEKLNRYLRQKKIKGILLKVSGPFHTSLMKEAEDLLASELDKLDFKAPRIPVYLNYSGEKALDEKEIKRGLIAQIFSPVKWMDIVKNIDSEGKGGEVFVEVGPKKVLKKIIEGIIPGAEAFHLEDNNSLRILEDHFKKEKP